MELTVCFLDDRLACDGPGLPEGLTEALSRQPLPDFTVLTEDFLRTARETGAIRSESESAGVPVLVYRGPPEEAPGWVEAAAAGPKEGRAVAVVIAPCAGIPALIEAIRPVLYITHPYRSPGDLRRFADQIVSDALFFNPDSAFALPLLSRPSPLGRALRSVVVRCVLTPLGRW